MSDWMIFAERLSEQMKKQYLSMRQLAERMDVSPSTICRYAKGQYVPRANEILKASDALGVTCDYLLGLSDDPRPSAQPERKKGYWHYRYVESMGMVAMVCSECGYPCSQIPMKYCANCGAPMRGEHYG